MHFTLKTLFVPLSIFVIISLPLSAATRGDIKILEASESIRYQINDFTRLYLIHYLFPKKGRLLYRMRKDLAGLTSSFQEIAVTTKDSKTKTLLTYFAYQKARIEEIMEKQADPTRLREILELSESFVEGANFIARRHSYNYDFEEQMYMKTRSMIHSMEEILKYYIAEKIIKDDKNIKVKMRRYMEKFEEDLHAINEYDYNDLQVTKDRQILNQVWKMNQHYFDDESKSYLPLVMSVSTERLESLLREIGTYHSRNQ